MSVALERLACLAGRSVRVSELSGGLTNRNLHVTADDGEDPADVVVRCWYGDAELLGIDRAAEAHNTAAAAEAGVGPRLLEYRPDLGALVIEWIPATTLSDASFTDPAVLRRAAAAVRRLHAGPRFRGDFDMFARRAAYLATITEQGYPLPAGYLDHEQDWERVRRALAAAPATTVPCNNDLLAANFLDDGARVWLIDYEYSGNNDPCFELGNTSTECGFTEEMTDAYVEAYFGTPGPQQLARVRLQMLASEYGWALWGFIQAAASTIDFDFRAWGQERFEKARRRFADPGFERLLDRAATGVPGWTALPERARVVVVGGGVIGCSVAYHLVALGWTDVLVLEQGRLSCGTTWHAAGLVGPLRASESGTRLVRYSAELYARLEQETGLSTGYRNVGGVVVARTPERLAHLRRTAANGTAYGLAAELVDPGRAAELWPLLRTDDLLGALWLPDDGKVDPADLTQSLARGARQGGARVVEGVRVREVVSADGRVTGVRTDQGDVEAEMVVCCAGQWAKALSDPLGVTVPLHSAEHFYVVTEPIAGTSPDLPLLRDPDGYTYFKEEVGGLVVGGFEPDAKPWRSPDDLPYPFEFQLLDEDWEHFSLLMDSAVHRVPALADAGLRKLYNGPESFTPDNQFVLGEAPGLAGYFVAAGFNSVGIASAGGAGRALAEWMVAGEPQEDLTGVDIRRFAPFHGDNTWLRARVAETLGLHYAVPWPNRELETGRPQRTSPLHERLAARGAVFGTKMGWERPLVFGAGDLEYGWGKPTWLPFSAAEQRACRTDVAVFDETSFSKYVVRGPDALALLDAVCAGDVDVPPGQCVYTPWLNARGGYEADLTVTRCDTEEFLVVSSSASTVRDLDWLHRHAPAGADLAIEDVTDDHAVIGVMGPRARALLATLTDADLSDDAFPFATSQRIEVAAVAVRATRMTYVGELGWEILVPMADAGAVYDAVSAAGATDAGYYAIDSLRLEKGYRAFGRELAPDATPREAGLLFATRLTAADLPEPRRRLVSVVCGDPGVMLWGGELLRRDGDPVGQLVSAAWGETVGACVGLAWIWGWPATADRLEVGGLSVDVDGATVPVTASLRPPLRPAR